MNKIPKKIYMIGIKGVGMSALALLYQSRGIVVSGSDTREKFFTDDILRRNNIPFIEGFDAANIPTDADLIVISSAYLRHSHNESDTPNPEVRHVLDNSLPMITYSEAVASIFNAHKRGIAVTGSHGKSTTSAMIAWVLEQAGKDPVALIGSSLIDWQSNARAGNSDYMVIEADDYEEKFLQYNPSILIITNTDWDHPDYFPDKASYIAAYKKLISKMPADAHIVINSVDPDASALVGTGTARTRATVHRFSASDVSGLTLRPHLHTPYNLQNAAAAATVARILDIDDNITKHALESFSGIKRRLEPMGTHNGALLIDDYAHHPTEIRATLRAIREMHPRKKLYVVFHPHTYTRTAAFLPQFADSFGAADFVIVLDVYSSAREAKSSVDSITLTRAIKKSRRGTTPAKPASRVKHISTIERATFFLMEQLEKGDHCDTVVISMGAGDVWRVTRALGEFR